MRSIILLLLVAASCPAQEIKVEPMPTEDLLRYLGVEPRDVALTKFSATFSTPKYGVLTFRKIVAGKEVQNHQLPLGPSTSFGVEVFLAPPDPKSRTLHYKLSTAAQSMGSTRVIELLPPGSSQKIEYMIGQGLPLVFRGTIDDAAYTLTFSSSDTPTQK
jgi:hypothetical protein